MSLETPLHKVEGMGSAHSGVGHFKHQRITAIALIPLTLTPQQPPVTLQQPVGGDVSTYFRCRRQRGLRLAG